MTKKAKPSRAAGGQSWRGSLLVPAFVVLLLLLGSLVVLALLMTGAPAALATVGSSATSRQLRSKQAAADGKCEDRSDMCDAWHKGGACRRSRSGAPSPAEMRATCPPALSNASQQRQSWPRPNLCWEAPSHLRRTAAV